MRKYMELTISRIILVVFAVVSCLFLVSACKSAESVFYEHQPSKKFHQNYDINDPDLQKFIDSGVVFVVNLRDIDNPALYRVWLGLYTNMPSKDVLIRLVRIEAGNWQKEFLLGETISLNEVDQQSKLFFESISLFDVDGEVLERAYQNNDTLRLKLIFEIDGKEGSMEYQLDRRVEKYVIYPT